MKLTLSVLVTAALIFGPIVASLGARRRSATGILVGTLAFLGALVVSFIHEAFK
jgi:hypothetical protein